MHRRLPRPVRLGLPAVAVLVLALAACGDPVPADPVTSGPAAPSAPSDLTPSSGTTGSDGLTVRYLDHGTVKTVRVEDFPR